MIFKLHEVIRGLQMQRMYQIFRAEYSLWYLMDKTNPYFKFDYPGGVRIGVSISGNAIELVLL